MKLGGLRQRLVTLSKRRKTKKEDGFTFDKTYIFKMSSTKIRRNKGAKKEIKIAKKSRLSNCKHISFSAGGSSSSWLGLNLIFLQFIIQNNDLRYIHTYIQTA